MPRQLLDHAQTEDRLLDGVMQHVQPDQAGVEVAVLANSPSNFVFDIRLRLS